MWRLVNVQVELENQKDPIDALLAFKDEVGFVPEVDLEEELKDMSEDPKVTEIKNSAKAIAALSEKYGIAVDLIAEALMKTSDVVRGVGQGDTSKVEFELTQWEDVNRTYQSARDIEEEIKNLGVEWGEVLNFALAVLGVIAKRLVL